MDYNIGERLWYLGYLWDLPLSTAQTLDENSGQFRDAVAKLQTTHLASYLEAGQLIHGRAVRVDGLPLDATKHLLNPTMRLCGLPDIAPTPEQFAKIVPAEVSLQWYRCVKTMVQEAQGSGSWKAGCYPQIYKDHCVTVHFDTSHFTKSWLDNWTEIKSRVLKAFAEVGVLLKEVEKKSDANLHVSHQNGRGWIGLAQLPGSNPSCSLQLFCYVDTSFFRGIDSACQLLCHELGHNNNLGHTSQSVRNVMSPVINWREVGFVGFPKDDASRSTLDRYYGGEPVILDNDPEDPEDPEDPKDPPTKPTWDLTIHRPLKAGRYKLVADRDGDGIWTLS